MLFADSIAACPELLPELEKILSSVDTSNLSPPASPSDQVPIARATKKRKTEDGKGMQICMPHLAVCANISSADSAGVCLPRDQLLTMTSSQIEDYVCKLKSQRALSATEEKELKRQRRYHLAPTILEC